MKARKIGVILSLLVSVHVTLFAQISIPDHLEGSPIDSLALWLHDHTPARLYIDKDAATLPVTFPSTDRALPQVISSTVAAHGLYEYKDERGFYFLSRTPIVQHIDRGLFGELEDSSVARPNRSAYLSTLQARPNQTIVIGDERSGLDQQEVVIRGKVVDEATDEPVFGATIKVNELGTGVSTDPDGSYELVMPKGKYTVSIRSLEKQPLDLTLLVFSNDTLNLKMAGKLMNLKEVVISAEARVNVERPEMGFEKLSVAQVKSIPRMMGEPDIVKAALLLPGVQSVAEGSGQLNVRGAPADQNIFYLDGIPVYNTTHLMGFFSAFTPNALSDFSIYKSSLPSRYGGRLSSVFEVGTSKGDSTQFGLRGGISPITTDVQVEGPAVTPNLTYMAAVRSTYSSWLLDRIDVPALNASSAGFQDAIARLHYAPTDKGSFSSTFYLSQDRVNLNGLTSYQYMNQGASLRWNRSLRYKHSLRLSASVGRYRFEEENVQVTQRAFQSFSAIQHSEVRAELVLRPSTNHTIQVGANSILYQLDLGMISPLHEESLIKSIDMGQEQGLESGVYLEEQWRVSSRLTVKAGTRLNLYQFLGPNEAFVYQDEDDRSADEVIDTLHFESREVIHSSIDPDFRLAAKYSISELLSVKASINRSHQYINILSNNVTITPSARWKLADRNIRPMEGWQYSLGMFKNFYRRFEVSVEGYYKTVQDLIDYREGAELIFSPRPETEVVQGDLHAYGLEFMLRKTTGKLTGWFNYTYARSFIRADLVNDGAAYPASFDKPHSVNLSMAYQYSTRIGFSANVIYMSGRPVTYPSSVFYQSDFPLTYYSSRNEFRIPYYFRCDLGMSVEGNLKKNKKFHGSWHFSIYNLFGRNNPFTVYAVPEDGRINGYQLSIFGSPIPSVAYQLKLGNYAR